MDDPRLAEPTWFYLHWAGIGYLFLRMAHVQADVGRGLLPAPAAVDYFAYLLFPPTLRMGPIYRFGAFAQQLHGDLERGRSLPAAAGRLLAGFIRLGIMAALLKHAPLDRLYGEIDQLNRLSTDRFLAGIYIAPMTIYLWIGGYTDLAVGVGRIMGFTVPENFHYPWVATSIADFWRRWHLTLGAWLRDYIYIPLGGSRRHVTLNYLVTFLFCGLWHGTYPAMVLWGLSQGLGLAVWRVWNRFWTRQAERTTPLCRAARRLRLKDGPLGTALAWLLTFHYQILTINVILDERHAGRLMAGRLAELISLRG
ncbi:MAG: MBOAT family protein [Phycisphaerae bacterium]